jgi:hypothetical protein
MLIIFHHLQFLKKMALVFARKINILMSADLAPSLAKVPCCNVSKIITKIMYAVNIKLSIAATVQFEIHPRCQETK